MNVPTLEEAKRLLSEAGRRNPGPWVDHSIFTAEAARNIASSHRKLNSEIAYILGYLHDIGRRYGIKTSIHTLETMTVMPKKRSLSENTSQESSTLSMMN